jgi:hypothetical protein
MPKNCLGNVKLPIPKYFTRLWSQKANPACHRQNRNNALENTSLLGAAFLQFVRLEWI